MPVGPKSHEERTIQASSPAAASPWSFVRPYADCGFGPSDSVRLALAAVEDVVARVVDERHTERGDVGRPAHVDRGRGLRLVLGTVDVRPRGGVQNDAGQLEPSGGGSSTSQSARVSPTTPS